MEPPATIGSSRAQGIVAFHVYCLTMNAAGVRGCDRQARLLFDQVGLPDDTVFHDIPKRRRFVCSRCGARSFDIFPDWKDAKMSDGTEPPDFLDKRPAQQRAAMQAKVDAGRSS